jgi:hypothetical protein
MARFEEIAPNSGVDSLRPGAEWIMVPKGKSNFVCLTGGAGYGVKAVEGKSYVRIAEISEDKHADEIGHINALFIGKDDKLLRITGLQRGPGKIAATKGSDKAELKFSVHGSRTFNISFFFLHDLDAQNRSTPRTAFSQKDAAGWVERLNQVYGPQANIWFELGKNTPLAVSGLGAVVTSDHAQMLADHKDAQVATGKSKESKAPIRVFLAGPALRSSDTLDPFGFYHIESKVILLQDQQEPNIWDKLGGPTSLMLKTLAHEIGHFLNHLQGAGQGHKHYEDTGYVSDILNTIDGSDIKISRQRVLDWDPT